MKIKHFVTVKHTSSGTRGILCTRKGEGYSQDKEWTSGEIHGLLGSMDLVLSPESKPYTEESMKKINKWIPLSEYKGILGLGFEEKENIK